MIWVQLIITSFIGSWLGFSFILRSYLHYKHSSLSKEGFLCYIISFKLLYHHPIFLLPNSEAFNPAGDTLH